MRFASRPAFLDKLLAVARLAEYGGKDASSYKRQKDGEQVNVLKLLGQNSRNDV